MLLPAESIYGGTWSSVSGPAPPEMVDFELMHEMRWSWTDLQNTPTYVQRYCWDLLNARREAEKAANDKAMEEAKRGG